jgi:phosphoribosylformylglycinamidine synthase
MNQYLVEIDVMPHEALLDPQGKAVLTGLARLDLSSVVDVRVGKHIRLNLYALTSSEAESMAHKACKELLANPVMESYTLTVREWE